MEKIRNKILLWVAIGGVLYLAFTLYADYQSVIDAFRNFPLIWLPVILLLAFANYLVRFSKWHYYLGLINVKVKFWDSFFIFMSGLVMSVTPGKLGELLKCYLVKQVNGTRKSKTAPIIFVERVTDFLSLTILALIGAFIYDYGRPVLIGIGVAMVFIIYIISNRKIAIWLLELLQKISFVKKYAIQIEHLYESAYVLLRPVPLFLMTVVSFFSWFFECFAYYLVLIHIGIDVHLFWAVFVYAFGTIVGAVSMLPGGLGVTEGSLTYMIVQKGYPLNNAVAATFLIRVATLWFAVVVGILAIGVYQKRFGECNFSEGESNDGKMNLTT